MASRLTGNRSIRAGARLFSSADKLRESMEQSHHEQVGFGLIFEQSGNDFRAKSAEPFEKRGEAGAMSRADHSTEEAIWGPMETRWSHPPVDAKVRPSSASSVTP